MNKTQVLALLKENRNERGMANWKKGGHGDGGLKSFGIGLTVLRKLAKQVGRDHALAMANALVGIGKRNKKLNRAAARVAKQVGPIDFNDGSRRKSWRASRRRRRRRGPSSSRESRRRSRSNASKTEMPPLASGVSGQEAF